MKPKSCMFVSKKSIIKMLLISNCCFWPKYESIIHNNASSSEKSPTPVVTQFKMHPYVCLDMLSLVMVNDLYISLRIIFCIIEYVTNKRTLICTDFFPEIDQATFFSDGTHSLQSKWYNATFLQIWWRTNSSTSWMAWGSFLGKLFL